MPFDFAYEVKDDPTYQDYSHKETSDGKVVSGSYRVALPDGRTQIVSYKADENGYVADVQYEGEAKYDEIKPTAAPAYPSKPAQPAYPETKPEPKPQPSYPAAAEPTYPKPSYPAPAVPAASKPSYPAPAAPKPSYPAPAAPKPSYSQPAQPAYPKPTY